MKLPYTRLGRRVALAAFVAVIGTTIAVAATSDAHTPSVTPSCTGLTVDLESYVGQSNSVDVTIDGVAHDAIFAASYKHTFPWSQTDPHTWSVTVISVDHGGEINPSGVQAPCQAPTTTIPAPASSTTVAPPAPSTTSAPTPSSTSPSSTAPTAPSSTSSGPPTTVVSSSGSPTTTSPSTEPPSSTVPTPTVPTCSGICAPADVIPGPTVDDTVCIDNGRGDGTGTLHDGTVCQVADDLAPAPAADTPTPSAPTGDVLPATGRDTTGATALAIALAGAGFILILIARRKARA